MVALAWCWCGFYNEDFPNDPVDIILLVLTEWISNLLPLSPQPSLTVSLQTSQPRLLSLKVEVAENFSQFQHRSFHQVLDIYYVVGVELSKSGLIYLVKYDVTILRQS